MSRLNGSCLCGDIKVTIPTGLKWSNCWCMSCRKAYGYTHTGDWGCPSEQCDISGPDLDVYAERGESGGEVLRYSCPRCHSPIYTHSTVDQPENFYVKIGLFEVKDVPPPSYVIWGKNIASWEKTYEGIDVKQKQ